MTPPETPPLSSASGRDRRSRPSAAAGASRTLPVLALLVVATVLTFSRVVGHRFLPEFDDSLYVVGNPWVLRGLTPESVRWAFTTAEVAFWCPVTLLSHMLDVELFGLHPAGHHLSSVLVHAGATAALFIALRGMTGALWRSALVAALFAVHPLHVESVAWVSERKDVLCGLFWFLGLGAYLRYLRKPSLPRYGALLAAYAAALMSKSMAVTFPFVLLLLDLWPLGRFRAISAPEAAGRGADARRNRVWLEKIPLLLLVPVVAALSYRAQVAIGAISGWREYDLGHRVANALISYVAYLGKTLFPSGLAAYYPHPGEAVSLPGAALCGVLLLFATAGSARLVRSRPWLATGWLWYLGTLVPVIGLVQIGQFARADRFTYVPLVGVFVAGVWAAGDLCGRRRVSTLRRGAVALAAVAALAAAAWVQTGYWSDTVTLLTHAVAVTRDNEAARMHLGIALARQGETERAADQFREVLRINDNTVPALDALAGILEGKGDHEAARTLRVRARSLDLAFATAQTISTPAGAAPGRPAFGPGDFNNAGVGEARRGRYREAEAHFRKALELSPGYAGARYNLASLYRDLGRPDEAYAEYARTIALDPGHAGAHLNLGALLEARGDLPAARAAYGKALRLDPGLSAARERLAALDAAPAGARPR